MLDKERLLSLWDQVVTVECEGVSGALVECGVWKGGAVAWMALASQSVVREPHRTIHLFDAFDDICEPIPELDGERAVAMAAELGGRDDFEGRLQPIKGVYDGKGGHGTVEACREVVERRAGYPADLCEYHVGWFQDTVPVASVPEIAVLRLDGDWYESTRVCLEHLHPAVQPGGYVVIDDYLTFDGCRRAVDEYRELNGIDNPLIEISRDAVYWRR